MRDFLSAAAFTIMVTLFGACSSAPKPAPPQRAERTGWYGEKLPSGILRRTQVLPGEPPFRRIDGKRTQKAEEAREYIRLKDRAIMVYIPSGTFTMGANKWDGTALRSEKPAIYVYLSSYYMDKYEITFRQFQRFVRQTGYQTKAEEEGFSFQWNGKKWTKIKGISWKQPFPSEQKGIEDQSLHPAAHLSYQDCQAYAKWAGGLLPTEAQWERAARGEDRRKYPWGNRWPKGVFFANATLRKGWEYLSLDGYPYTAPVGSFPKGASAYGCMDMAGNLWEWCRDTWETRWYARLHREGKGKKKVWTNLWNQKKGKYKSIRGGGWCPTPRDYRVTSRGRNKPSYRAGDLGFRLVVPGREK